MWLCCGILLLVFYCGFIIMLSQWCVIVGICGFRLGCCWCCCARQWRDTLLWFIIRLPMLCIIAGVYCLLWCYYVVVRVIAGARGFRIMGPLGVVRLLL